MGTNPLIAQGTLNRLRGSLVIPGSPELNVTAPFLGKDGISLVPEGDSTQFIETMTGAVTSPEVYMTVRVQIALLRTQGLADLYKKRMELNSLLGDVTVRPDAATLSPWSLINCSIQNVGELRINGQDAGYGPSIKGYYLINSQLWDLTP